MHSVDEMYNSIWQAKVGVEVVDGRNLLRKNEKGLSNVFVELSLDGQKIRTTVKENDHNPCWNEKFYFNIYYPDELPKLTLEAHVYSYINRNGKSKASLGKARIVGTAFVPDSVAAVSHYPLERGSLFSRSSGKLGLKVFIIRSQAYGMVRGLSQNNTVDYRPGGSRYSTQSLEPFGQFTYEQNNHVAKDLIRSNTVGHQPGSAQFSMQSQERYEQFPDEQNNNFAKDLIRSNTVGHRPGSSRYSTQSLKPYEQVPESTSTMIPHQQNYYLAEDSFRGKTVSYQPGGFQKSAMNYGVGQERAESHSGRLVRSNSYSIGHTEFELEESSQVQPTQFLFVRVVKARDLPGMGERKTLNPYVEVRIEDYRGLTTHIEKCLNPEWNAVFAFSEERIAQSSAVFIAVMSKDFIKNEFVGVVWVDLHEIPRQFPPYNPTDPEWYPLKSKSGKNRKGELMLAVWKGTEADEAYADAMASQCVFL